MENVKNAGIAVGSMFAGAVLSRIIAGFIPVKNETIKGVALTAIPLVLAGITKNEMAVNVAVGASATQAGYLVKSLVGDKVKNETVQKALGTPEQPIIIYAEEEEFVDEPNFLSLPEWEDEFASV